MEGGRSGAEQQPLRGNEQDHSQMNKDLLQCSNVMM